MLDAHSRTWPVWTAAIVAFFRFAKAALRGAL
jgi:hypothetical protein